MMWSMKYPMEPTLIPFDGVLNRDGVSKLGDRLGGDHAAHL